METSEIREDRRPSATWKRVSFGAILVLVTLQMLLFLYLVTVGWQFRSLMLPPGDPEIVVRTRTVFANGVWLGGNVVALAVYVLRRGRLGRYVLLAVLAVDLMNSVSFSSAIRRQPCNGSRPDWSRWWRWCCSGTSLAKRSVCTDRGRVVGGDGSPTPLTDSLRLMV